MLQRIPRHPRKITAPELKNDLEEAGYLTTVRTAQRDLKALSAEFPLQADERSPPFGWSWTAGSELMDIPGMNGRTAFTFNLVDTLIKPTFRQPTTLRHSMLAEIHGKLSRTGANLSERLEDQLTGDVFGALRYVDSDFGLLPILTTSYILSESRKRRYLSFVSPHIKKITFWPWIQEAEPDLLIEITEADGIQSVVLIEAKYNSGLSSDDSVAGPSDPPFTDQHLGEPALEIEDRSAKSRNQLVRQMRGMKAAYPNHRRIEIYLTADKILPQDILSRVEKSAANEGLGDTELYWLSWHDFARVLNRGKCHLPARERLVLSDVCSLLERKGFVRFTAVAKPHRSSPARLNILVATPPSKAVRKFSLRTHELRDVPPRAILTQLASLPNTNLRRESIYNGE